MQENLFTPVSVRRRSAAQGCANAHPHARSAWGGRDEAQGDHVDVGFGQVKRFTERITEQIKGCEISLFIPSQHLVTAL